MTAIQGVYAAALTPRRLGMQDVNLGVLWDLVDFLCERKVDGIVLLGATGEFVHYGTAERMRMMGLAPKRSRVPVLINVTHSTLDGSVELGQAAAASGAAGVLLMPPHFYRYDAESVCTFYRRFVEEADIDIPVLIYNLPQFTNGMSSGAVQELVREGVVHGIKDSAGDWPLLEGLLKLRTETGCVVMAGNDSFYARARQLGGSGVVSGVASALPELLVAVDKAIGAKDEPAIARLQSLLEEFIAWLDVFPTPVGIKEAAMLRGLKLGPHAIPLSPAQEVRAAEFRDWFKDFLPAVLHEAKQV